jgi:hypothetical protein
VGGTALLVSKSQSDSGSGAAPGSLKGRFVKRSCLIVLGTAATVVTLALPGVVRAHFSTDGWSWNDSAAAASASGGNLSIDGWSWGDEPE